MPNRTKTIKIHTVYRNHSNNIRRVPVLRLSGVWLEKVGFTAGRQVTITIREELLIIQPIKNP